MIGSIVVEVAAAIITAVVIGTATLVAKIYRGQQESRAEDREFRLRLSQNAAETASIQAKFTECQRNCRARTGDYIRTETKLEGMERRVAHLEDLADAGGL